MTTQRITVPTYWLELIRNGVSFKGETIIPPDRMAADAFEALFRAATSRDGTDAIVGDRISAADPGETSDNQITIARKLVLVDPNDATKSITLDPASVTIAAREGGFMRVIGAKFGSTDDIFDWTGGAAADLEAITKGSAFHAYANESGQLVEYSTGGAGSISWSNSATPPVIAGSTATVTHSNDGTTAGTTNGNDIVVTMSLTYVWTGPYQVTPPSTPANPSADMILTRNYNGGGASTVYSNTITGVGAVVEGPYPGTYAQQQSITWTLQYTDSTGDTEDRVFILELDALHDLVSGGTATTAILSLATTEEP